MHLRPLAALVTVVARSCSALRTGLQGATIQDGRSRRLRGTAFDLAHQHAQVVDYRLEDARLEPALGLLIDRVPWRQVVGHEAPLYTCVHDVAQVVEDLAQREHALRLEFGPVEQDIWVEAVSSGVACTLSTGSASDSVG